MSRAVKEMVNDHFRKRYASLDSVLVVNLHKLKGTEVNELRGELGKKDIEVHVVKNRLVRRVLVGTALEPIGAVLTGPCAFVTGGSSPVEAAKELVRLSKDYAALELGVGLVEGETEIIPIEELSKRKSRAELQGEIVMLAVSPGRRLAGCLNAGGRIAGCIKAIADKLEKGETIAKVA